MSEITVQGLLTDAGIIRGEIHDSQNSHDRVGKMFEDIIKYIQAHEGSWATGGGGGGGGTSSITGTLLLNGLNGKDNPSLDDQILHWSSNTGWGYITTPTGGSGTGGGVTWQQLRANTSEQIDASHLSDALSNYVAKANMAGTNAVYEWWGNKFPATPSNGVYKINGAIEFSNGVRIAPEEGNHTLKIEAWDNSSNPAHIYTTGGVSALGNSSSGGGGGGGGEGTPLNNLLGHINSNDYYGTTGTVSPSTGDTIIYNGSKWKVGSIDLEDLLGTAPAQFVADKILAKDSGDNYKWIDASGIGGSTSITNLWEVGDVGTDSGYTNTIADGHILQYGNSKWNNVAFGINAGTANSILSSITLGSNTYSLPQANGTGTNAAMGIVKASTGLSATNGVLSVNLSTSDLPSGIPVNKLAASSVTFNGASASLGSSGTITPELVIDGNTIKSKVGNQTSGGITIPFATTAGIADKAKKVSDSNGNLLTKYAWGQKYIDDGEFQNLTDSITVTIPNSRSQDSGNNHKGIIIKRDSVSTNFYFDAVSATNSVIRMVGDNIIDYVKGASNPGLIIGYGSRPTISTTLSGKDVSLQVYDPASITEQNPNPGKDVIKLTTGFQTHLPQATQASSGLRIGNAVLYWDNDSKALALQSYNDQGQLTTGSFYATGGVSALGMSSGSGSVSAMTFGSLTVNNDIAVGGSISFGTATIYEDTSAIQIEDTSVNISGYLKVLTGENNTTGGIWFGNYHLWVNAQGKLVFEGTVLN